MTRPATNVAWLRVEVLEARASVPVPRSVRLAPEPVEPAPVVEQAPSWLEQASCRGRPTSWWYPERYDRFAGAVAKLICAGCPVKRECLEEALDEERLCGPPYGIRGGRSAEARVRMLRRRRRC